MTTNRVIGRNKQLPWHLPADLKHFKALTMGKPIIMGRATYQSIGKPLPGRDNIVVTSDRHFKAEGCHVVGSIKEALASAGDDKEIMIIGGASVYEQSLGLVQRIYMTLIHQEMTGDTFFPSLDERQWIELERINYSADAKNPYDFSFIILEKAKNVDE